jgi:hypothetical protein
VLKLLGLKLAVITLDLAIVAKHRFAEWVEAVEAGGSGQTLSPRDGSHALRPSLTGNGKRTAADGELEEILEMLDKTAKMLD